MSDILIVDPNKVYARMIKGILMEQLKDPRIDIAGNVHELRRRLGTKKYNIVMADLSIAMDGDEMARELKKVSKNTTVVAWSALEGKDGFVRKPSTMFELRAAINSVLEETCETARVKSLEETQLMITP
jgi:DNA-binding response OmpR family regulator